MRPSELLALASRRVVLLDGGLGSMLIAAGLPAGRAPDWWNLERPDAVLAVHEAYAEAGCEIVHANTFGASPPRLVASGLEGRCSQVNGAAVAVARRAVGGRALVAGDLGPTGLLLPPLGGATVVELRDAFREQVRALAAAGVDLLSIETMTDLREARAAGLAVMASLTFEARRRGAFTIMGDPLVASLSALRDAGADVVGLNCTLTAAQMLPLVAEAAPAVGAPLAAQPNAGKPRAMAEGVVYDADPESFARDLVALAGAGAALVGGCCGTTPAFLAAARAALGEGVRA